MEMDNLTLTISAPAGLATAVAPLPESFNLPLAPPAVTAPQFATFNATGQFDLKLLLRSAFASDVTTVLGTQTEALMGGDSLDTSELPTLGQTMAVYFDHNDWGGTTSRYNADYQPPMQVGETRMWEFVVFTDKSDAEMTLSWA